MRRGDVVRVQLPRPAGRPGREQFGIRPAIIVQIDQATANLSTAVIVPLTSNQQALKFDGSFSLSPSRQNGLTVESVALTQQIRAIDKDRIQGVIGCLVRDELDQLETELRSLLGL